ncbi:hypothetical protein YC2023_040068 [Brassica napus]
MLQDIYLLVMTINAKERHSSIGFTINAVAAVLTIPVCEIRSETTADFSTSSGKQCESFSLSHFNNLKSSRRRLPVIL